MYNYYVDWATEDLEIYKFVKTDQMKYKHFF